MYTVFFFRRRKILILLNSRELNRDYCRVNAMFGISLVHEEYIRYQTRWNWWSARVRINIVASLVSKERKISVGKRWRQLSPWRPLFRPLPMARPLDLRAPFVRRLQLRREKELSHTTWLTNCDWADSPGFYSILRSTCVREVRRYRDISFGERFRMRYLDLQQEEENS